jgi:hypothetical protein
MRQWLTSTFSRKLSTSKVKQLCKPERIIHEFKEDILKAEELIFQEAKQFLSGDQCYRIEPKDYPGVTLDATVGDWKWTPDGELMRRMYGHYILKSKTREFEQSFYAQAVIGQEEIKANSTRSLVQLMEHKTYNMECTFTTVLELSYGKGQNFPISRGRFTILEIHNHERDKGKQEGSGNTIPPKKGDVAGVPKDTQKEGTDNL